jgi:agmatinase
MVGKGFAKAFWQPWEGLLRKRKGTNVVNSQPVDPTMWNSLLHAGLAGSFMSFPHVPPSADALREAGAKAAIYGIPFDSTSISRTGANYGPRGMREVSCQFLTYNATLDFDLIEALAPVDTGDCDIALANPAVTFDRAKADLLEILRAGALPVTLGGDHSVTIPAAWAVTEHVEDPALILIDTHLDTAPDVGGEKLNHCCPITRAVEAGFDPSRVVLIGMSGWMNPRTEYEYCREQGIRVIWLEEIWEKGAAWAVQEAREITRAAAGGVYLSFDVDSLDAAHGAATCCPTPGGLTSREAIELVRGVSAGGLVGVDVVEVAPSLEATAATSLIGIRIAVEAMAFHAGASL